MAINAEALARSAFIDQRRDQQSLRTFTPSQQPPFHTIDGTHNGVFPANRVPHANYTLERKHFPHVSNRPTEEKEQIVRPRVEPNFSHLEDRSVGVTSSSCGDVASASC